jgi:hypothetical protein
MNTSIQKEIKKIFLMGLLVVTAGELAKYYLGISPYIHGITRGFGLAALILIVIKVVKSKNAS